MEKCSPSKNKSGGPDGQKNERLTKAATGHSGRMSQKRGSSEHNTKPRYAKKMKKGATENFDMEF